MKRLIILAVTILLACGPAIGSTPPKDPLAFFPQPKGDEFLLYLEINNFSFFLDISEGQWFHNLLVNLGDLKEEDIVAIHAAIGVLRTFLKEASIVAYLKSPEINLMGKERNVKAKVFTILRTKTNPKVIVKALDMKLEQEGNIGKFNLERYTLYAYLDESYAIISNDKAALKMLVSPIRLKLLKIWEEDTTIPIPKHEKGDLYAFIKAPKDKNLLKEHIEILGKAEKSSFVLNVNVKERGTTPIAFNPRPLYTQIPGKGKPLILGALSLDGSVIISMLKLALPPITIPAMLTPLSITEDELTKLLTGRLYLVIGGESKIFEIPSIGLYLYFLSDLPPEELSQIFKKVMGGIMGNLGLEGIIKIDNMPGWDALCTSNLPMDLMIGLKGREIIIGIVSPETLSSKVELASHVEDILKSSNLSFLYINISELKTSLNKLLEPIQNLSGEKDAEETEKLLLVIPPWKEIIGRSLDQRRGEIRIIY
ncbi:MAG: hypothetical protein NZ900_01625 [Synergistetes bacterium]|nr:hypothetical protein [Synergistota bacterium]MDW8191626.1 hypothetical protein [Synergistota bacterium]